MSPAPRWRAAARAAGLCAALAAAGCASETGFVQVGEQPSQELALRSVAVAPFRAELRADGEVLPEDAAALVAGYVAEALAARGLEVVPPSDVAQALARTGAEDRAAVARAVGEQFGVDAVAVGSVHRYRERSGEALGTLDPASVGFVVRLLDVPTGRTLWSGAFDETQVALGENLLKAPQYPGAGTRWLSAAEFARWGAERVVRQIPIAATASP